MSLRCVEFTLSPATLEDIARAAAAVARVVADGDVVLLNGTLGAGKTTFTQAFARELGVCEAVVSPTFTIVNTYESGRIPLHHFDVYRLNVVEELDDVDFWELVDASTPGVSVVEWASRFADDMPDEALSITIAPCSEGSDVRTLQFEAFGVRAEEALEAIRSVCL